MKKLLITVLAATAITVSAQADMLRSNLSTFDNIAADQIELRNDGFVEGGGEAYLQMGFVKGEKAGVMLQVPASIEYFKVDSFRVLIGNSSTPGMPSTMDSQVQIFFQMGIMPAGFNQPYVPGQIENAAQLTAGPYWNDVPAEGSDSKLKCARGGELIGASLEFVHDGLPSVYRDVDGLQNANKNFIFAVPGGWNYSAAFGLRGDWILRVVGHKATAADCPRN